MYYYNPVGSTGDAAFLKNPNLTTSNKNSFKRQQQTSSFRTVITNDRKGLIQTLVDLPPTIAPYKLVSHSVVLVHCGEALANSGPPRAVPPLSASVMNADALHHTMMRDRIYIAPEA
jgi:hypothetical protein